MLLKEKYKKKKCCLLQQMLEEENGSSKKRGNTKIRERCLANLHLTHGIFIIIALIDSGRANAITIANVRLG